MTIDQEFYDHRDDLDIHYTQSEIRITTSQITDWYKDLDPQLVPPSSDQGFDEKKVLTAGIKNGLQYWAFTNHYDLINIGRYTHDDIDIHIDSGNSHLPPSEIIDENKYLRAHITGDTWEDIDHDDLLNIGSNSHEVIDQFLIDTDITLDNKLDLFKQLNEPLQSKSGDIWQAAIGDIAVDPNGSPYVTYGVGYNMRTLSAAVASASICKTYKSPPFRISNLTPNGSGYTFQSPAVENKYGNLAWFNDGMSFYSLYLSPLRASDAVIEFYLHTVDEAYNPATVNNVVVEETNIAKHNSLNDYIGGTAAFFSPDGKYLLFYGNYLGTISVSVPFDLSSILTAVNVITDIKNLYFLIGPENKYIIGAYASVNTSTTIHIGMFGNPNDATSLVQISSTQSYEAFNTLVPKADEPIKSSATDFDYVILDETGYFLTLLFYVTNFDKYLATYRLVAPFSVDNLDQAVFIESKVVPIPSESNFMHWSPLGNFLHTQAINKSFVQSTVTPPLSCDPIATGFFLDETGTKLYTAHKTAAAIYEQTLDIPFEIGSLQPTFISELDVSNEIGYEEIIGVSLFNNGNVIWVITNNKQIYQYNAITPYVLTGAIFQTKQFINGVPEDIYSIGFSIPGTRGYAMTSGGLYTFSIGISGDADTIAKLHFIPVADMNYAFDPAEEYGAFVDDIGNALFIVGKNTISDGVIIEYNIINYETYDLTYVTQSIVREMLRPNFGIWSADGTKLYVKGIDDEIIFQYISGEVILNEPVPHEGWDITTLANDHRYTYVSGTGNGSAIPWLTKQGLKMYYFERANPVNRFFERNVERYWDISGSTLETWQDINDIGDNPWGIWVNDKGTKLFLFDSLNGYEWTFGFPFDIKTLAMDPDVIQSSIWDGFIVNNVTINRDGYNAYATPIYSVGNPYVIYWATSDTPGDITRFLFEAPIYIFEAYLPHAGVASVTTNDKGNLLFIAHTDIIQVFELGTLFDPNSATFISQTKLEEGTIISNISWSETGHKLYVYEDAINRISQYSSMGILEPSYGHNIHVAVEY